MKNWISTAAGMVGGMIASIYGGWSVTLQVLFWFMAFDYVTGLLVAGLFHASPKSGHGGLESRAGWKGLARKIVTMMLVLMAHEIDLLLGIHYIRDAAAIGFCTNEALSIIENAGLMGIPIPKAITGAIDQLMQKEDRHDGT